MITSFQLLRTNPALTTNISIVVSNKLYLESIDSTDELNDLKLKRVVINNESYYEYELAKFWKDVSSDLIYNVRNNQDPQFIYDDWQDQYDDIYRCGGNYITDTWYDEEFEYFAPLYARKDLPKWFFIFRVDGHGHLNTELTSSNFKTEIIKKLKAVKAWDLETSNIGTFLNKNINRDVFPKSALTISYKPMEFSYWTGFNLNGGIVSKGKFLDYLWIKNIPFYNLEKIITDEWQANSVIYPFIWNLKFLFNDSPATPTSLKKYSINRYYGFYFESLELVQAYTPYNITYLFNENKIYNENYKYILVKNKFYRIVLDAKAQPFIKNGVVQYVVFGADPILGGWQDSRDNSYWFWYQDRFLKITRQLETIDGVEDWTYSIISDEFITIDTTDIFDLTQYKSKLIKFKYENSTNTIYRINDTSPTTDTPLVINDLFTVDTNINYSYLLLPNKSKHELNRLQEYDTSAYDSIQTQWNNLTVNDKTTLICEELYNGVDLYLIQINSDWFVLNTNGQQLIINADASIESDIRDIRYTINNIVSSIDMKNISSIFGPPVVKIFRTKFCDIRDFDFNRDVTKFTRYEYEDTRKISDSTEPKMYFKEWFNNNTEPFDYLETVNRIKDVSDIFDDINASSIPVSTEYVINAELFELDESGLTHIWDKNQSICKWGHIGSLHNHDYPYRLHNSIEGGWFSFGPNLLSESSNWRDRNFDYCYFNWPIGLKLNLTPYNSCHIWNSWYDNEIIITSDVPAPKYLGTTNNPNQFSLEAYKSSTLNNNYFIKFFTDQKYNLAPSNKQSNTIKESTEKYSYFNFGSKDTASYTIFKGLKYVIKKVIHIDPTVDQKTINTIVGVNTDEYNNYTFSAIMQFINISTSDSLGRDLTTRMLSETDISTSNTETGTIWTKPTINIIINRNTKSILLRIEIPSGDTSLQNIFEWNQKELDKGRIDRYLYRDVAKKDWNKLSGFGSASDNTLWINYATNPDILFHDVELLTAFNIINFINNFYSNDIQFTQLVTIKYTIIDNTYLATSTENFKEFTLDNQWQSFTLPIFIQIEEPDNYALYKNSFKIDSITTNIELQAENRVNSIEAVPIIKNLNYISINEPISYNYSELPIPDLFDMSSIDANNAVSMWKYSGSYDPIYEKISLFKKPDILDDLIQNNMTISDNYKFDTQLYNFALIREIASKVNSLGSILKTRNNYITPLYPRIDEWGYFIDETFIFKSCWDRIFYTKHYNLKMETQAELKTIFPDKINKFI